MKEDLKIIIRFQKDLHKTIIEKLENKLRKEEELLKINFHNEVKAMTKIDGSGHTPHTEKLLQLITHW